jgi:hypothetical protein
MKFRETTNIQIVTNQTLATWAVRPFNGTDLWAQRYEMSGSFDELRFSIELELWCNSLNLQLENV